MPRLNPNFLSAVFTAQNFLWIFQFGGGTIIEIIIIYPLDNCFYPTVFEYPKHLIDKLTSI
ncbi:MAG TPA: hypothetical protein VH500_11295 [Nitrososphaeraceae archaeon]